MSAYVSPFLTFLLFLAGLLAWRQQLLDKRKFEVAEQALVTFSKIAEGLRVLRQRNDWTGMHEWIESQKPANNYRRHLARREWMYRIPEGKRSEFEFALRELGPTRVLASLYLTPSVDRQLLVLWLSYQRVLSAAEMLMSIDPATDKSIDPANDPEPNPEPDYDTSENEMTPEQEIEQEREQLPIRFTNPFPNSPDDISSAVAQAQITIHELCKPYADINPYSFLGRLGSSLIPPRKQ